MRQGLWMLSTIAALSGIVACSHHAAGPPAATASPDETAQRSTIPSGTTFNARLDAPISSERLEAGDAVSAHLDDALVAPDGTIVAPRGATLRGHVLEVERAGLNRVALQFDGLVLNGQVYPIYAQLLRIETARTVVSNVGDPSSVAANVYPSSGPDLGPLVNPDGVAIGGGPGSEIVPLELPRDALAHFVLSRPFSLTPVAAEVKQGTGEVDRTFQ
jgi:hypothetical protein